MSFSTRARSGLSISLSLSLSLSPAEGGDEGVDVGDDRLDHLGRALPLTPLVSLLISLIEGRVYPLIEGRVYPLIEGWVYPLIEGRSSRDGSTP